MTTILSHRLPWLAQYDESKETLQAFLSKSLALCFAGEGLVNEPEMDIAAYLKGNEIN